MKEKNKVLGLTGETTAAKYLQKQGYKILKTNYSCKCGEIDLIAMQKDVLIFVEVKNRDTLAFGLPSEAVNFPKQRKIRKTAQYFLLEQKLHDVACRFDVIEIIGDKINHIENAF